MGYRSDYVLTFESLLPVDPTVLSKALLDCTGYNWDHSNSGQCFSLYSAKWYEQSEDMIVLSGKYPDVKFSIHSQGEDSEQWIVYAYAGKIQYCKGIMTFEERTLW